MVVSMDPLSTTMLAWREGATAPSLLSRPAHASGHAWTRPPDTAVIICVIIATIVDWTCELLLLRMGVALGMGMRSPR